jgi:DNA polymerase III alpha subunit
MDIDIDLNRDFDIDRHFDVIKASRIQNGELKKHNVGVYFQNIPIDKVTGYAAIPYDKAEALGFMKIDFLHLNLLDNFTTKDQVRTFASVEPDWSMLENPDIVSKLFQLHRHFNTVIKVKPQSIDELADCIALIRPDKKKYIDKYVKNPEEIRKILYLKEEGGTYSFKRSHSLAYATNIVIQLNLLRLEEDET